MSQDAAALWERVLERDPELKETLSSTRVVEPGDKPIGDDPSAGPDTEFENEEAESADLLAGFDPTIRVDDDGVDDDGGKPIQAENVVDVTFEESADLWLSRSHLALEHALQSMRLRDVFPTNRPLLIFASRRSKLAEPEYHRVEVTPNGWPHHLQSTEPLTSTAATEILVRSSHSNSPCFEGETVAVEVPNPLLARDRWIVLWPELKMLPKAAELHQWQQVRRVVWCEDGEQQIGPRDVIDWLSRSWPDIPIRIALFRAASFIHDEKDTEAKLKKLSGVRRALGKFDRIKSHPWIVVGP